MLDVHLAWLVVLCYFNSSLLLGTLNTITAITLSIFASHISLGVKGAHAILRLALIRRKICQRLLSLPHNRSLYALASRLDAY